jgi:hypothetical protein
MARQLRWWIAAPLGACLVIAIGYLPPRPMPLMGQRFFRVFQTFEPPTPYRQRVQELASRYRLTSFELAMREYGEAMRPELERRRALELPGPTVHFAGPDSLTDSARNLVRALLDTAWYQLGLGNSKISVGVVVSVVFNRPPGGDSPSHMPAAPAFLLPDSTNRATCLAYVPIIYWGRPGLLQEANPAPAYYHAELLRNGLGTCAYFAAFGAPGHDIGRWLASQHYEFALYPWGLRVSPESTRAGSLLDADKPWFWSFVYRYEPGAVECMAGRADACRRTVLASGTGDLVPVVSAEKQWWRPPSLAGADRYFADLVADIGPERFRRFWNSELPVDTALATAMRMPVGEWTRRWQATLVPPIRLGPVTPPSALVLATLLGVVAVVLVMLTATRRQVR